MRVYLLSFLICCKFLFFRNLRTTRTGRTMVEGRASAPGRTTRPAWPIALILALTACAPASSRLDSRPHPAEAEAWVAGTLGELSLRRKVAQLVFPRIPGAFLPTESPAWERIRGWVEDEGVGGLIATIGPPMEAATTFNALQGLAEVPLLITADMEHGPGQLLNAGTVLPYGLDNGGATRFPPVMALGATGEERFAYELGRITAQEARAVGVHMTFAPVVDVNNNPDNPIINTRSYGADAALVSRFATAHVRGLQEHGMLATAKHFPGHGDTGTDSHIELPIITVSAARADSLELVPYRAAIEAGVAAVMSAHIAFPALTGDSVPATLNAAILTTLLRNQLGFEGIVATDAMDMGAIVDGWGPTEASVLAIKAGADLLLQVNPQDVGPVIDAVVAAVERGDITQARIDRSVRRILGAKARLGLHRQRQVDLSAVPRALSTEHALDIAQEAADRSITAVRDRDGLLPIRDKRVLSIVFAGDPDPWAGRVFQRMLGDALPELETVTLSISSSPKELERVRSMATQAELVLFAPFIRVGAYKDDLGVPEPVAGLLRELIRFRPTALVSFGNPYLLKQFPEVGTYVLAWGQWEAPQRAAARAVTGAIPISGRLPIALPPEYGVGDGITIDPTDVRRGPASPLDSDLVAPLSSALPEEVGFSPDLPSEVLRVVRKGVLEGATPGAAVVVGRAGRLALSTTHGRLDHEEGSAPVTDSTIFDLASLTKVVATTTAVMLLVDDGVLELDAPVMRYLPEFGRDPDKHTITVRHLLTHSSGLPGWRPYHLDGLRGRTPYLLAIAKTPLEFDPGTSTQYSDLGAIILGLVVERLSGQTLDVLLQERVFGPLGMRDTGFNPLLWTQGQSRADGDVPITLSSILDRIAPTEVDTTFRHRHIRGEVHDENAWALGGVAGHAGLFSSTRDLARFAQMLLAGGRFGHLRLIREETIAAFTRPSEEGVARALGWEAQGAHSSAGDAFSPLSYGHTGFTGTSLWVDVEKNLFVILLTNRINPTRENPRIGPLRKAVHYAVQNAVRTDAVADQRGSIR